MIIKDDPAINHGIELALGNEQYEFFNCFCLADAVMRPSITLNILRKPVISFL